MRSGGVGEVGGVYAWQKGPYRNFIMGQKESDRETAAERAKGRPRPTENT